MVENPTPKRRGRKPAPAILMPEQPVAAPDSVEAVVPATMSSPAALEAATTELPAEPLEVSSADAAPETTVSETMPADAPAADPALTEETALPVAETPIVSAAAEPTLKGPTPMATTYDATATTEKAKAVFGDFNERAKSAMEKSVKLGEEMTEFTKGNVEALVTSGRVAAKGCETMAQDVAESMKKHFESTTATMKSFASVKSPTELFQLQSDYAKTYFDGAVAEASKFSESMLKLMGDIAQPLSSRYALAAEKFKASAL